MLLCILFSKQVSGKCQENGEKWHSWKIFIFSNLENRTIFHTNTPRRNRPAVRAMLDTPAVNRRAKHHAR
jgi:hypothetical protein